MGAVFYNQAVNSYLGSKMEIGQKPNNKPYKDGAYYTGKEHSWDEAFGYWGSAAHALTLSAEQNYNVAKKKDMASADFNGDGVFDVFQTENVSINKDKTGKNDMFFLSQPDGTWLESTATHITGGWHNVTEWNKGFGVKKGKGLINFSHGSTIGDIDGGGAVNQRRYCFP